MHFSIARRALLLAVAVCAAAATARAADGFFTVGQRDGRWWFFTPAGERFFSTGVNVVDPGGYYSPACNCSPYYDQIMKLYGSEEAWAAVTLQRLNDWHFNTLGGWSKWSLFAGEMPYTIVLGLGDADDLAGGVADYWSEDFLQNVATKTAQCAGLAADPLLIGYFIDNEMHWGPEARSLLDLFADYVALPADAAGKIALMTWLRERYHNDVAAFDAAYYLNVASFDEFPELTKVFPVPENAQQADDRTAWAGYVADQFFRVTTEAIRAQDPNHLIMGVRFVSWYTPTIVVQAAAPYIDVMTVNHYLVWPIFQQLQEDLALFCRFVPAEDLAQDFYYLSGKPVLITEFGFRGLDAVPPSTWPPQWLFETAKDQTERAAWTVDYLHDCINAPHCIGYHWFAYMDEPAAGRWDGENSNFGLVAETDDPYPQVVDAFTLVNQEIYGPPFTPAP
jgi:agarase